MVSHKHRMPFGQYRGHLIRELPADYLAWLWSIELRSPLREAVKAEMENRQCNSQPSAAMSADARSIVRRWYRELAAEFHPDAGGSLEAMRALNIARDRLLKLLEAAA
jgi:hypothetical protein